MYNFGLIGYPVKHSLSPWIHEQFMKRADIDGAYQLFGIEPEADLRDNINRLKENGINGFNVTVPYKEKVMPLLDEIDVEAKQIGAVNTVLLKNNQWIGYNTDGKGYVRSLKHYYPALEKERAKKTLLLGAGGAARGIYYALMKDGFPQVDIANRTEQSAIDIVSLNNGEMKSDVLSLEQAENELHTYDLIIQTTTVGMTPNDQQSVISLKNLQKETIVSDIVYQPIKTKILQEAENKHANIHHGHTMLLYQAQYAFEIWTNKTVPIEGLDDQLKLLLEGR